MTTPLILLTGTYNSKNKGDAAMELSTAQAILRRRIGEPVIMSPFPDLDGPFYTGVRVENTHRRRLIRASLQWMLCLLHAVLRKVLRFRADFLLVGQELKLYNACGAVVDLSGDMLTEDYGPHVAYSHYLPILIPMALGKPVFLCAQSIGPFRLTLIMARMLLMRAKAVTARDEITYDYLRRLGIAKHFQNSGKADYFKQTADTAFMLQPASSDVVTKIIEEEQLSFPAKKLKVGVSISYLVAGKYPAGSADFFKVFASLLAEAAQRFNLHYTFVAHVTGPAQNKDDRLAAADTIAAWPQADSGGAQPPAQVVERELRPDEIKGLISTFDVFIGARMHANIAALSTGVPTLALAYSHKTPGIMRSLAMEEMVIHIKQFSQYAFEQGIERLINDKQSLKETLLNTLPGVRQSSESNMDILADILANQSPITAQAQPH